MTPNPVTVSADELYAMARAFDDCQYGVGTITKAAAALRELAALRQGRQGEVSQPRIVDINGNNPRDAGTLAIELLRRLEWDDEGRCIECGYLRKHTMGCGVGLLLDGNAAPVSSSVGAQDEGPLFGTGKRIECAIQDDPMLRDFGWLYIKHASGNWVTAAKLEPFSMAILRAAGSIK